MFSGIKGWLSKRENREPYGVTTSDLIVDGKAALDVNAYFDGTYVDAFGRLKVSTPVTLFDSKQLYDNQPLFFDDQETSGSGTGSTYNSNKASTSLTVSSATAGTRVRQTFQRFNYKSGKALNALFTARMVSHGAGITARVGYFDDKNGIYFESKDGVINIVKRSYTSGAVVEERVPYTDWNGDTMNGRGLSRVQLDPFRCQIMFVDIEWLGVGRVRCGFFYKGRPIVAHTFDHANVVKSVYMSTPNLPIRYEISNDGTGPAAELEHICSSVISEGSIEKTGMLRHADSGSIGPLNNSNKYAILGLRLKSTHLDLTTLIEGISALATSSNDVAHWELIFNPTVAGTFTFNDVADSGVQVAIGSNSNTVTGGYEIDGGYFSNALPNNAVTPNALRLGAAIDGTVDTVVLAVRPVTNNITCEGSITWRELS